MTGEKLDNVLLDSSSAELDSFSYQLVLVRLEFQFFILGKIRNSRSFVNNEAVSRA